jgi:3'(2'), 5'-bisphosphate nucleotidase
MISHHSDHAPKFHHRPMQPGISRSKTPIVVLLVSLVILAFSFLTPTTILPRLRLFTSHFTPTTIRPLTTTTSTTSTTATMAASYSQELNIALLAVQRAAILTKSVFHSHAKGTLSKNDASPVTIGDFGAQALIIAALQHAFPNDEIVAEEEAKDLRENESLRDLVWDLVQNAKLSDASAEETLGGPMKSAEQMLDIIDKGDSKGGASGRIWAIDPIDGTKGFLRGGQYAVCLGLMVDGDVKVGVLGLPNLPESDSEPLVEGIGAEQTDAAGKGVLISAVQGQGAVSRPLGKGALAEGHSIQMKPLSNVSDATFCESVEAGHSSQGDAADIARKLGITKPSVRMDSQAKYGSIARGAGDLYLRLPVKKDYQEKIWDHAAGDLIVREAGGEVTDTEGKRLDFSHGRTLKENKGVIAAPKSVHAEVIEAVKSVLGGK